MEDSKFARQIVAELPGLIENNVIDKTTAESLRCHYELKIKPSGSMSIGLTISAILSGLLVGAGIILLIANNWENLSKPVRVVVAMLPLIISAGLAGYTIWRRMDSTAWREGSGTFYFLSIAASIALVSQTYHLYNDLSTFLFIWILLALPLIYLLNSSTVFVGCLVCIVAYSFHINEKYWAGGFSWKPMLLLVPVLPFYGWMAWKRIDSQSFVWMSYALALAIPLMMVQSFHQNSSEAYYCTYGMLFAVYYLVSCRWFQQFPRYRNPFRIIGCLGLATISIIASFSLVYRRNEWIFSENIHASMIACTAISCLAWLALVFDLVRRKILFNAVAAALPVVLVLVFGWCYVSGVGGLIMNIYLLALGVFTLVRGVRRDSLISMNEGMGLIAILIVCRFFDNDYSTVSRGVVFILLGCGFLIGNVLAIKSRKNKKNSIA